MPTIILFAVWKNFGYNMIIFLASLQSVPEDLYEAARIDRANVAQQFWHITLPMISPVIMFTLVTSMIGALQTFTQVYVISNGLGGPNNASLVYVLYLFLNGFRWFRLGYASALAWVLFIVITVLTLLMIRASRNLVYYETPGA